MVFELSASIDEWAAIGETPFSQSFAFSYGDVFVVTVPADATSGLVEGTLKTKQKFKFVWPGTDPTGILKLEKNEVTPAGRRLYFRVKTPV